jgi:membrane associated rhomboid family serine protease
MPLISFGIIILCFLVHVWVINSSKTQSGVMQKNLLEYFTYYQDHPYLEFGSKIRERFKLDSDKKMAAVSKILSRGKKISEPDEGTIESEQEELDRLEAKFVISLDKMPFRKYGFIPRRKNFLNAVSYQFIHGGWLHLLFNLYLFFLLGYCLEDAWGKLIFLGFYLLGGIFAAYMYAAHFPGFAGPLIGASGSIAAVMGAFLVRFWKVKIKFVYIFYFIYNGTFKLPAWIALVIWGLIQIVGAGVQQSMMKSFGIKGGGTAYWAHVWGFVFGVGFAYLMKFFEVEERFVNPILNKKDKYVDEKYVHFEKAMELNEKGRTVEAFETMIIALQNDRLNYEAGEKMWELGILLKRQSEARDPYLKMIETEIKNGKFDRALFHFRELKIKFPDITLSIHSKISLMEYFFNANMIKDATIIAEQIATEFTPGSSPGLVIQYFEILLKFDSKIARNYLQVLRSSTAIDQNSREKMIQRISASAAEKKSFVDSTVNQQQNSPKHIRSETIKITQGSGESKELKSELKEKCLSVQSGMPLYFKNNYLAIDISSRKKALLFEKIRMLSVVRIVPENGRSYLVVDLFLDLPNINKNKIEVIRLLSKNFFPKRIFPQAKNTLDAFKKFLEKLHRHSHAKPFPDLDSIKLSTLKKFKSIEDYESFVLHG